MTCSKRGFPPHKWDVINSVQNFIQKDPNRVTPFKNGRPGKRWWKVSLFQFVCLI